MAHRFNVVSVGPNDECAIVVWVVVRAQARRPVVLATGREGSTVELVDLLAIFRRERDVHTPRLFGGLT